jgi:hypothetical protein
MKDNVNIVVTSPTLSYDGETDDNLFVIISITAGTGLKTLANTKKPTQL